MAKTGSKSGTIVKRGAGGRFMGSVKYRNEAGRAVRSGRSTGGVPFREARAAYEFHVRSGRGTSTENLKANIKMARAHIPPKGGQNKGPTTEFRMAIMGAASKRALHERGIKLVETRWGGVQYHGASSGRNTGAKAAARVSHDGGKTPKKAPVYRGPEREWAGAPKSFEGSFRRGGALYRGGYNTLGSARGFFSSAVEMYRSERPSKLGGQLTRMKTNIRRGEQLSNPTEQQKYETASSHIHHRAVVRVINERRADKKKAR